jgi:biopolymer transport protein ExbD
MPTKLTTEQKEALLPLLRTWNQGDIVETDLRVQRKTLETKITDIDAKQKATLHAIGKVLLGANERLPYGHEVHVVVDGSLYLLKNHSSGCDISVYTVSTERLS